MTVTSDITNTISLRLTIAAIATADRLQALTTGLDGIDPAEAARELTTRLLRGHRSAR